MSTIFRKELKLNLKSLLIWSIATGSLGFICILLYESMQGDMEKMAEAFSGMGAFSDAFGMSTLSIGTLKGFFATEVGTVHGLGSAMFAAVTASGILSGEEEAHTGEFLYALPLSRTCAAAAKGLCTAALAAVFTAICAVFYFAGTAVLGEFLPAAEFAAFMTGQFFMNLEIAAVCFAVSALSGKNRPGTGIGIALLFYLFDIVGRTVPDLKETLFLGPYSYANASVIFSGGNIPPAAWGTAALVILCSVLSAFFFFNRRDLK